MDILGLLGLLLLFFSGRGAPPAPPPAGSRPWPTPRARRRRRTPPIVEPREQTSLPPAPAPWPQVLPSGLPPFPGAGWEHDEPPPLPVQQRAAQLVSTLWARGSGSHKIEQTAGRWVAYQAQIVASGKQGIVAYRLRKTLPRPSPSAPPSRVPPRSPQPPIQVRTGPAWIEPEPRVAPVSVLELPTLRVGMGMPPASPHADVALMQQRMGISPADGRFGPGTLRSVRAYQTSRRLAADGIVGKQTWAALFTAAPGAEGARGEA